ncbi:MAG: amidohydrolase [Marinomonas sp.]
MNNIPQLTINPNAVNEVIKLRRHFHQNPETAFTEYWTTSEICHYLSNLGFDISYGKTLYQQAYPEVQHIADLVQIDKKHVDDAYQAAKSTIKEQKWIDAMEGGFTGVIATLPCAKKGATIGFRFNIDGLPIKESEHQKHKPYLENFLSENNNMHACGHDGHTAIGLALAKQIAEHKDELSGRFVLVFQPAEEGPSGGEVFAKFDIFKQLEYLVPLHLGIINERKVVCGLSFLSLKSYKVTFSGRNAHAAVSPETGNNAIQAACTAVTGIYGIPRHGGGISRMNIGQLSSNNPSNVISDHAEFELELRGENNAICDYLHDRASSVIKGAALMHGVDVTVESQGDYVSAKNSNKGIAILKQAILNAGLTEDAIIEHHLSSASEDATFLMNEVNKHSGSASYLCLGSPTVGGHHHPDFDFDEDMLLYGVKILWEYIQHIKSIN